MFCPVGIASEFHRTSIGPGERQTPINAPPDARINLLLRIGGAPLAMSQVVGCQAERFAEAAIEVDLGRGQAEHQEIGEIVIELCLGNDA